MTLGRVPPLPAFSMSPDRATVQLGMDVATAQAQIDQAIQAAAPEDGWYLSGWVVVAEWVPPEGSKVLSQIRSAGLTPWAESGFLYDALEGGTWDDDDED